MIEKGPFCFIFPKDLDAGNDWRQKKKGTTEDAMVGWHHWPDGHEFEQAQGGLACCSPWGRKESDTTEPLNWTESPLRKYCRALENHDNINIFQSKTKEITAGNCGWLYWFTAARDTTHLGNSRASPWGVTTQYGLAFRWFEGRTWECGAWLWTGCYKKAEVTVSLSIFMKSSRKAGSESEAVIGKEAAVFILTRKRGIFGHLVVWRMFVFLFTFWLDNAMVLVFLFFPLTIVVLDWPCPTLVILWNCFSTAREHQTVLDAQSCRTLCDPMDGSPPGSSVHGILQARIL